MPSQFAELWHTFERDMDDLGGLGQEKMCETAV